MNDYRIIEWIWSYWMNTELLNICKVIQWINKYWINTKFLFEQI